MSIFYLDYLNGNDAITDTPLGWWSVAYTGGTGPAPAPNEVVTGAVSGSTAKLTVVVPPTGGSWAGNDASGMMYFYGKSAAFQAEQVNFAGGGHMHIEADLIYCAWKTMILGATAARIAPGDTIRMAKSDDPVSLGVNGTWISGSATITLASGITVNIETCEANWSVPANVIAGTTINNKEGTNAITLAVAAAFETGVCGYKNIATLDLSSYQQISFWIYTDVAIAANSLRLDLCTDDAGATPVHSYTIPFKLEASHWYACSCNFGVPLDDAIESVALNVLIDLGGSTVTIRLDNIFAHNGFSLLSLIGKNTAGETWWTIKSINGTTVILGESQMQTSTYLTKYYGAGEATLAYRRETIKTTLATAVGTVIQASTETGTYVAHFLYSGGWNKVDNIQDGLTFFDGVMGWGYGMQPGANHGWIDLEKIGLVRYYCGLMGQYGGTFYGSYDTIHAIGNDYVGIAMSIWATLNNSFSIQTGIAAGYGIQVTSKGSVRSTKILSNMNSIYHVSGIDAILEDCILAEARTSEFYLTESVVLTLINCITASVTLYYLANFYGEGAIYYQNYNQTPGDHRMHQVYHKPTGVTNYYVIKTDSVLYKTAAPSMRITPGLSTQKAYSSNFGRRLMLGAKQVAVADGETVTCNVWVRQSSGYNGAKPRLIVRRNVIAGITVDTVLDTAEAAVAANDTDPTIGWEQLFGTTPAVADDCVLEFIVDCDGTVGWVNVDDWSVS